MNMSLKIALLMAGASTLTACGVTPNPGVGANGELPVIARPFDNAYDSRGDLGSLNPSVVYDPDGCQGWLIDSGLEGYSSRRRDPRSGLPICNGIVPPGTVVGEYRNGPFPDFVPVAR